jgi:hypothetical protein
MRFALTHRLPSHCVTSTLTEKKICRDVKAGDLPFEQPTVRRAFTASAASTKTVVRQVRIQLAKAGLDAIGVLTSLRCRRLP